MKLISIVVCLFVLVSCNGIKGSGHIKKEERTVNSFDGLESSGSIDIDVKYGPSQLVEIEADDNILQYVVTKIENGLLIVTYKPNMSFINTHVKAYVTTPSLDRIYSSGSADIVSRDTLHDAKSIEVKVGGSGDIDAVVNAPSVTGDVSGSGNIQLHGLTRNFDLSVSGSGDAKCRDLMSENTTVDVAGSGTAHVFASLKLTAKVSGSGDIIYSGNPSSPSIVKNGSGSVRSEK